MYYSFDRRLKSNLFDIQRQVSKDRGVGRHHSHQHHHQHQHLLHHIQAASHSGEVAAGGVVGGNVLGIGTAVGNSTASSAVNNNNALNVGLTSAITSRGTHAIGAGSLFGVVGGALISRRISFPDLTKLSSSAAPYFRSHHQFRSHHLPSSARRRGTLNFQGHLFRKRLQQSTKANSDSLCNELLDFDQNDASLGGICAPSLRQRNNSSGGGGGSEERTLSRQRNNQRQHFRAQPSCLPNRQISKKFVRNNAPTEGRGIVLRKLTGDVMSASAAHTVADVIKPLSGSHSLHDVNEISTPNQTELSTELEKMSLKSGGMTAKHSFIEDTRRNGTSCVSQLTHSGDYDSNGNFITAELAAESSAASFQTNTMTTTTERIKVADANSRRVRKWQKHVGGNRFFCNGRIIISRQCSILFLTIFLIIFTMTLFCLFDLPFLMEKVSITLPFVTALLFLLVMSSLFKTSFSDPGIIPRAPFREVIEWERQMSSWRINANGFTEWTPPRTKIIQVDGQNVKLKYCFTCCIFRPPRSSHCSICDNCILNFDHHCPWVGNCIGLRNYRHFYFFITILSVMNCFVGACVTTHLVILSNETGTFLNAIKESPWSIFTGIIALISVWSIVGLSGFHTYLIAINQTTNEDIKGTFSSKNRPTIRNPYSSSNCFKNIFHTLFGPEPPSLLDRRGIVEEDRVVTVDEKLFQQFVANHSNFFAGIVDENENRNNDGKGSLCDIHIKRGNYGEDTSLSQRTPATHLRNAIVPARSLVSLSSLTTSNITLAAVSVTPARSAVQCAASTAAGCGAAASRGLESDGGGGDDFESFSGSMDVANIASVIEDNVERAKRVIPAAGRRDNFAAANEHENSAATILSKCTTSSRSRNGFAKTSSRKHSRHEPLRRLSAHKDAPNLLKPSAKI